MAEKRNYRWRDERFYARVNNEIANRVNAYQEKYNALQSDYQKRNAGRKYTYEDAYVSDSADWANSVSQRRSELDAEADSISAYIDRFTDGLDANWVKQIKSGLTDTKKYQGMMADAATKDHEWWSNFENAEAYQQAGVSWNELQDMLAVDIHSAKRERDTQEQAVWQRRDELAEQRGQLYTQWQNSWDKAERDALWQQIEAIDKQQADLILEEQSLGEKKDYLWQVENVQKYNNLQDNEDWAELSSKSAPLGIYKKTNSALKDMNADEIAEFNYVYNTQGAGAAKDYLDYLSYTLNARRMEKQAAWARDFANSLPFLSNSYGVGANLVSGIGYLDALGQDLVGRIKENVTGEYSGPIDYNRSAMAPTVQASTIRGTTAQKIVADYQNSALLGAFLDENTRQALGQGASDLYQLGMSAVDSVATAALTKIGIPPALGTTLLSGSAATQGMLDAIAKGASDAEAVSLGLMNGVFEYLFERFEIEGLLSAISGGKLSNVVMQALTEGFGEGATSAANMLADITVMAEKSDWQKSIASYMDVDPSMSRKEAEWNAFRDATLQIGKDAIGGMLMGAGMTAGSIGINKTASAAANAHRNYQTGKVITGTQGGVESLKALGADLSEVAEDGTRAQIEKLSGKVTDKKGIAHIVNQANVGKLFSAVTSAATEKSSADIAKSLERKGYAADEANSIAEAISAAIGGKGLTGEQTATFKSAIDDERVQQALKDIVLNKKSTTNQTRQKVKQFAKEAGLIETEYSALENRVDKRYSTSKEGKTVLSSTGEEVSVSEVVSLDGGKMSVRLGNGQVVDASEIDFANDSQSYLYSAVSKIENITPGAATAIIKDYDPASGQTVGAYLNGVDEAFTYGYHGYSEADLKAGEYTGKLTDVQLKSAYVLGQSARKVTDDAKVAKHKKMRTAAQAEADKKSKDTEKSSTTVAKKEKVAKQKTRLESDDAEVYFQDGKSTVRFDEHTGKYDEKRMAAVNYAKFLSKLGIGGKYFFYESYVKDGKRYYKDANGNEVEAPNGMYMEGDGSIHIDMNAGDYGQGTTLFTLGHELTHFIKEWSPDKFKVLADFLIEEYGKTDMTMHERVLAKQNRLTEIRGKSVSYNEAFEEVVADAMSTMLTDGNLHEKLAKLRAKDKRLFNKIKQFFEKLVAKFRGIYAELTPEQKDARDVRAMKDAFDKIQQAFAEALVEASDNFRAAEGQKNTTEDGGVKLMSRDQNLNVVVDENVDFEKVRMTLTEIYNGNYKSNNNYFPVLKNTPKVYMDYCHLDADRSFVMAKKKAYKAMQQRNKKQHALGVDGLMYVIENLATPDYIVYQNVGEYAGNYAAIIISEEREIFAAVQLGEYKDAQYAPNGEKGYYNTLITAFYPNEGYLDNNIFIPDNDVVYEKNEDPLQVASGVTPSDRAERSSANNILKSERIVKSKSSVRNSAHDSVGNKLTKEQQEFFKDSKIVDANGNLKVMYHGSPESFTVFDKKKARSSGYYGKGFYFTDSDSHAKQYGSTYEVYLNITNPLQNGTNDITKEQFRKFVAAIAENEEYGLDNYGERATVNSVTNSVYGKGDFAILMDINASCVGDFVEAVELFNEVNGTDYDGIIAPTETVAFYPEQIKRTDNKTPTSNPDTRYSYRGTNKDGIEVYETSQDVKNLTRKERQQQFLDIMANEYRGRTAKFIRNGHAYYATFDEKDVNKNIYGDKRSDKKGYRAKINAGADGDIFDLVENAKYDGSSPEKGKKITAHKGVGYWDYFIKTVQIDGTVFDLLANVRKKADGAFVYSIQLNENKKIKASPPLGLLSKASNGVTNASATTVAQPAPKVKSQNSGSNSERNIGGTSNRSLLANAFEGITKSSIEYKLIQEYKGRIKILNEYEEKLAKLNAEIREIRFGTKGKRDTERLARLEAEAKNTAQSINRQDKKLLSLEASEPLRKVLERERKKEAQKTKEHVKEIRQKMKESAAVKEKRAVVEKAAKALMDMLAHPTKDAHVPTALHKPLQEFLESIDFSSQTQLAGKGMTIRDVAYTRALTEVRSAIAGQRSAMDGAEDGTFELDIPDSFLTEIDDHIRVINSATKGLDLTTNRVYEMNSDELADLGYMLRTINKAIRHIDKLHMAGAKARVSQLGRDTRLEMSKRKPVKGESGGKAMWANFTPWHAFRRMGKAAQQIFKGLMQGQSKLARTIASVIQFAEKTYTAKEAKAWEHKKHTIELDSGKTITMTPAQIMSFYCLSKRQHAKGHMMGGGIRIGTIKNDVKDSVQEHAKELVQKEHYTLTEQDIINIISHLTDRQISVAEALQQYMQNVGGRLNNEISMARWDYMAATEDNYFPIKTDDSTRDVKDPGQEKSNLWALLNKSFTKGLTPGANNAMVVESIFDVFADHMSEVAEYNAFALPLVDAMKWFNYRERIKLDDTHIKDVGVQKSIRDALGTSAVKYFVDLMTDINSSQKAGRHENLAGQILSRSKVASVGWNLRVAIQQPTAILRASLILDISSLLKGAIRIGTKKLVKEMQQYSGIALWKSMGYYDLNVSRNVREQIKGDDSLMDKFNELGMWLPGKMDEITWARIWAATKAKVAKEQKLSGEELLQATAELFEEVVYQTQVADSVLTRSSMMRSKTQFMKEATSFMAEPTASVNILLSAFQDYEDGHTTWGKVKRGLAIGFYGYALSATANAIATSLMDAWRDDDEYEEYWEKFVQALLGEKSFLDGNLFSELNPLEKIVFVRDFISLIKGYDVVPGYAELFQSGIDLVTNYKNFAEGRGSITAYGIVYQTLQVLGSASGFGVSNIAREVAGVWNNTIGKLYPDLLLHRYDEGAKNKIRNAYGAGTLTAQEAMQLLTDNGIVENEDEAYWMIQEWDNGSDYSKYEAVFEAVRNGRSIDEAMEELTSHGHTEKDVRSQIKSKIGKWYQDAAITKQQAIDMLTKYADMDEEDAASRVSYWAFCNKNPKYAKDINESKYNKYKEFAEPAEISLDVYAQYINGTKGIETIRDEWGDIELSERDQVLEVIDSLPLTWEQKDALYLAAGYAESKIWDVPW